MNFEITNTKDINNSRNAVNFVHTLTPFKSNIYIEKEGRRVNAKSILGLLSAAFVKGETLRIEIFGDDEVVEIKTALEKFFAEE